MEEIASKLATLVGVPVYLGDAPTMAAPPYILLRPMYTAPLSQALCGDAIVWDDQLSAHCVAGSAVASSNLAKAAVSSLHGLRHGGSRLGASASYTGSLIEGLYESQVTVTNHQGEL